MSILGENIASYLREHFGENFLRHYEEYVTSRPVYYLRFSRGIDKERLIERLSKYGIELRQVSMLPFAYAVVKGEENIGKTMEFALGKYYIQSLSSMIPPLVLNPSENDITLDLCAAPGSKTTEISELMNNNGTLYANEISVPRLRSLVHNLDKVNAVNVGVLNFKGELLSKIYDHYFDKILVDAPCSALGIIQKKEEVSRWWSGKQMEKIANTQLRLLISAIKTAKVGGEIVYSTCTLTLEENELVLQTVLKKYPVELVEIDLPISSHPAFTKYRNEFLHPSLEKARRIIPWEINSEGFFVAKLRKIGATESKNGEIPPKGKNEFVKKNDSVFRKYIEEINEHFGFEGGELERFNYILKGKNIFYINKSWKAPSLGVFNRVGTKFGNIDNRNSAHLHTQSAQYLGKKATRNIIYLESAEELKTYFDGGTIKSIKPETGQKIVAFEDYILGTAIATKDGLKSQFPRAHRTGTIIFPE